MANLFLKNTSTKWQSNLIDLNSAILLLSSQTMDQAKYWFAFIDDGSDVWVNVLDCRLIVEQLIQAPVIATAQMVMPAAKAVQQAEPPAAPAVKKSEVFHEQIQIPFETLQVEEDVQLPNEFFNPELHPEINVEEEAQLLEKEEIELNKPTHNPVIVATNPSEVELKGAEKRLHPRFDIRLRVIIKSGKNTFMTYTRDVSLGGLSLLNDVPDSIYNSEAEIYITAPDQRNNIMFSCLPVASKLGQSRLMFTKIETSKQKILAAWLHHFVKPLAQKVS